MAGRARLQHRWLIARRGLRRGEAAGRRWADIDLDTGPAMIEQQRIANGHLVTVGPPKTAAGRRQVDDATAQRMDGFLRGGGTYQAGG